MAIRINVSMLGITYVIICTFRKIKTVISPTRAKVFHLKMLVKVSSPVPVSFGQLGTN